MLLGRVGKFAEFLKSLPELFNITGKYYERTFHRKLPEFLISDLL